MDILSQTMLKYTLIISIHHNPYLFLSIDIWQYLYSTLIDGESLEFKIIWNNDRLLFKSLIL